MIVPKTRTEAMNLVREILNQGDDRYNSVENEVILSDFLIHDAITLENKEVPLMKRLNLGDKLEPILKIQRHEKLVAVELLKSEGFDEHEIFLERKFLGSRPDIIAKSSDKITIVECCSCRIDKIIDFLNEINEVWIITRGIPPWETTKYSKDKMQLFIFRKGPKWGEIHSKYKSSKLKDLKEIKSVLE